MSFKNERGTSLIEVLIALVLVSLLVKGAMHLTTRATAIHTEQQLLTMAISQMQDALSEDVCTTPPVITLPGIAPVTATVFQGCNIIPAVTINGTTINNIREPVGLSVDIPSLGGEVAVGGTLSH